MLGCWVLSSLSGKGSGRLRSQRPNIALWGEGILITVSLSGTEGEPRTGVAGWVGVPCWQRAGSCHWTKGTRGGGAGLVFAFLSPAYTLQRVSLCSPPLPPTPQERLVAAMLGPSLFLPSQPVVHHACAVRSLGRLPFAALLCGQPGSTGVAGPTAPLPSLCSHPVWTVAWPMWLLKPCCRPSRGESVLGPVRDLRGFWKAKRLDLGDQGGVSTGNRCSGFLLCPEEQPWSLDCGLTRAGTEPRPLLPPEKSAWRTAKAQETSAPE